LPSKPLSIEKWTDGGINWLAHCPKSTSLAKRLRHSCATLLLIAETNPKVVAERLGHTSVKMTLDTYSHVLPSMQKDATDKLEKLIYSHVS
jgi:integrase